MVLEVCLKAGFLREECPRRRVLSDFIHFHGIFLDP